MRQSSTQNILERGRRISAGVLLPLDTYHCCDIMIFANGLFVRYPEIGKGGHPSVVPVVHRNSRVGFYTVILLRLHIVGMPIMRFGEGFLELVSQVKVIRSIQYQSLDMGHLKRRCK